MTVKQINTLDSLLILQQENASNKQSVNGNKNYVLKASDLTALDGLAIYIKAIHKIQDRIKTIEKILIHHRLKRINDILDSQVKVELVESVQISKLILGEFIKNFSVVHDQIAKDFMILLIKRFEFMSSEFDLFLIKFEKSYIDSIKIVADRCILTFNKMREAMLNDNIGKG